MRTFITVTLFCLFFASLSAEPRFSSEEIRKIKGILSEMTEILEGNHKEILEIEDVLSRSGTALRKARNRERLRRKVNSWRDRLKDLKKIRLSFAMVPAMKEFIIHIDDRLKIMEDNIALIEEMYFPVSLDPQALQPEEDDYPTFINPGDPRYELDEEQQKLARAIQKSRNLVHLRNSRENKDHEFPGFVQELDKNLKAEHKPQRTQTPVLGVNRLDHFFDQIEEAQKKDPSFDWNEGRTDKEFREFFQEVEGLDTKATVNKRIVTGFPGVDTPDGAKSRKTFQELVTKMESEIKKTASRRVVMKSMGKLKPVSGINSYLNESPKDGHEVAKAEFQGFLSEMSPIHSEVIMSYQKGILKEGNTPSQVIRTKEKLAWVQDDMQYLRKLRNKRIFEQAAEFYQGEQLLAERTRRKSRTRFFDGEKFDEANEHFNEYIKEQTNKEGHRYDVAKANFFTKENSPSAHEVGDRKIPLIKHRLSDEKSLIPITVQVLDEEQTPHRELPMEFRLELPEDFPKITGVILEGGRATPLAAEQVTDYKGEATIHLLMNTFNREIQIDKEMEQVGDGVICTVRVNVN